MNLCHFSGQSCFSKCFGVQSPSVSKSHLTPVFIKYSLHKFQYQSSVSKLEKMGAIVWACAINPTSMVVFYCTSRESFACRFVVLLLDILQLDIGYNVPHSKVNIFLKLSFYILLCIEAYISGYQRPYLIYYLLVHPEQHLCLF